MQKISGLTVYDTKNKKMLDLLPDVEVGVLDIDCFFKFTISKTLRFNSTVILHIYIFKVPYAVILLGSKAPEAFKTHSLNLLQLCYLADIC